MGAYSIFKMEPFVGPTYRIMAVEGGTVPCISDPQFLFILFKRPFGKTNVCYLLVEDVGQGHQGAIFGEVDGHGIAIMQHDLIVISEVGLMEGKSRGREEQQIKQQAVPQHFSHRGSTLGEIVEKIIKK